MCTQNHCTCSTTKGCVVEVLTKDTYRQWEISSNGLTLKRIRRAVLFVVGQVFLLYSKCKPHSDGPIWARTSSMQEEVRGGSPHGVWRGREGEGGLGSPAG